MTLDPMVLGLSIGGVLLLLLVLIITGSSFISIVVVLFLVGILVYVLNLLGVLTFSFKNDVLDIKFTESAPAPAPTKQVLMADTNGASPIQQKEVFYISGNQYTYDDAPAVCAAYEAELASYDQVLEAYAGGAEWCGYGWTQGGMALFPTQEATWELLMQEASPQKRTQCGRPGVNGGYFDPNTKFGVNCYGVKPEDKGTKYPLPVPGSDPNSFNNMVNKYRSMINRMVVSPFNRSGWSEWSVGAQAPEVNTPTVNK
jgi:hypothetical protein